MVRPWVSALLLLCFVSPAWATAIPVTLSEGSASFTGTGRGFFAAAGETADGRRVTVQAIEGADFTGFVPCLAPFAPCRPGTPIPFGISGSLDRPISFATVGGNVPLSPSGIFFGETPLDPEATIGGTSTFVRFTAFGTVPATEGTVTTPFLFEGRAIPNPRSELPELTLFGSGTVSRTFSLAERPFFPGDLWGTGPVYSFEPGADALEAVPEPGIAALLGTGLAILARGALRRRRRIRRWLLGGSAG
jgi:hypothetical protein